MCKWRCYCTVNGAFSTTDLLKKCTRLNNLNNFYYWCSSRVLTLDRRFAKEILNSIGAKQAATDRDSAVIGKHTVGGIYVRDMLSFDIYEVLGKYPGPVLLFHGTADPYVSLAYTQRAQQALADARTVIVEGAGHGFYDEDRERVEGEAAAFVQEIAAA